MHRSPLLNTLTIIAECLDAPATMETLEVATGLSRRQIMRHMQEARHLGAEIYANGKGPGTRWACRNRDQLIESGLVHKWLQLEIERNNASITTDWLTHALPR